MLGLGVLGMSLIRLCCLLMGVQLLALGATLHAASDDAAAIMGGLMKAEQAYDEGRFGDAVQAYLSVHQAGHINGHVYYNLGNAYFRDGDVGHAMAAYLAARNYLPRDPDVRANLKYASSRIQDRLPTESPASIGDQVLFWTGSTTFEEQIRGLLVALTLFFLSLAMATWRSDWRRAWLSTAGGLGLVSLVIAAGCAWKTHALQNWGSVVTQSADVYSGPSEQGNSVLFTLHQGAPVRIDGVKGSWTKVVLSDGKKGWLPQTQVVTFL